MAGSPNSRARRYGRILAKILGVYLAILLALIVFQDRLAFSGWTFRKPWQARPAGVVVEEADVATSDGNRIRIWWLPPADWTPAQGAVVFMHGNGENVSNCGSVLKKWRDELKTGALGVDYPGYGCSSGTPTEQGCYAAAQASFDWLVQTKKVAPRDIVLVGQSLGGGVATELATREPCRMLITTGTFTSFPEIAQHRYFWLPVYWLTRLKFDNLEKMRTLKSPVFISHGTDDRAIPFSFGERLYAAATNAPRRFYAATGHGHEEPKDEEFFNAVRGFLEETSPPVAH